MPLKRTYPPAFELLWREYPNKSNKLGAFKAWEKKISEEDREELVQHVIERARFDAQWQKGFVPHLQSFINGARWEDAYIRVQSARYHPKYTEDPKVEIPAWQERGFSSPEAYRAHCDRQRDAAMEALREARLLFRAWYDPIATVYHRIPRARMSIEYMCRWAFAQGISDSFNEIRSRQCDECLFCRS